MANDSYNSGVDEFPVSDNGPIGGVVVIFRYKLQGTAINTARRINDFSRQDGAISSGNA